jgi:HAE1 family hydrophobic/amphiphilic exporter-1
VSIPHYFIERPVFACVISLVILLAGAVTYVLLPVDLFPDIAPPTVTVTAFYAGAGAETLANTVAVPLEKQINGVERMLYLSSSSTSDGSLNITVTFEPGTNPDTAAILVQNRINAALPMLPDTVRRTGIIVRKATTNMLALFSFYNPQDLENYKNGKSLSPEEASKRSLYLANFVKIYVQDQLARAQGVGNVAVFNAMDFSMRIWLNPELMALRKITIGDVSAALLTQNIDVASGRLGSPPVPKDTAFNLPLTALGQFSDTEQFENIVLRTDWDGSMLRLKDIAQIELGSLSYQTNSIYNGIPAVAVAIYQMPGSNALQVSKNLEKIIKDMQESQGLFGDEITCEKAFSTADYIEVSLEELKHTLLECIVIVIIVVFLFLQSWRAALIPIMTVPVSLVGCFFLMYLLGFSINLLTLFGLILAIGIVVDDAIVVIENTQRIIDEEGLSSYEAARKAMTEVTGPVIATTFVLLAVFIPAAMATGMTGTIYQQLALTISGCVTISTVCALTFAPALAAILLRPTNRQKTRNPIFRVFNFFFDGYASFYGRTLGWFLRHRITVLFFWFLILATVIAVFRFLPGGFMPNEDQGMLFVNVTLQDGASLERTCKVVEDLQKMFDNDNAGIKNVTFIEGVSIFDGAETNAAFAIITLTPWKERYLTRFERLGLLIGVKPKPGRPQGNELTASALQTKWTTKLQNYMDAKIMVAPPPSAGSSGGVGGLEFQLLDRNGRGHDELYKTTQEVIKQLRDTGLFVFVNSTYSPYSPRYFLDIDRDKMAKLGTSMSELTTTLSGLYGSMFINNFTKFNNSFNVNLQALGDYRTKPEDVLNTEFRHPNGEMIPVRTVAEIRTTTGPQVLNRYQLYPSVCVTEFLNTGVTTGKGMKAIADVMRNYPNYGYMWSGMAYQESSVGNTTGILFVLSMAFAFLALCALYESWSTPIIILMAVPLGLAGSLAAAVFSFIGINIYTQIGFILMIGLSSKNAILITEFAVEQYRKGMTSVDAAIFAGKKRFRPIMMTSFAFIIGVLPLAFATGAGAVCRNAVGTPVCGGMLTETLIGVYVTPVLFVLWTYCFKRKNSPCENRT